MAGSERDEEDGAEPSLRAGGPEPVPPGDKEWQARRERLAERLEAHRPKDEARPDGIRSTTAGSMAEGLKLASEFVAGILVGAGIGYLIDKFAGTKPFGLIVFLLLGFVAGILNVLRSISGKSIAPPLFVDKNDRPDRK